MPRIDNNQRAMIAHMIGQGLDPTKIAKEVGCARTSVSGYAKQLKETGTIACKKWGGLSRKITVAKDINIVTTAEIYPTMTIFRRL